MSDSEHPAYTCKPRHHSRYKNAAFTSWSGVTVLTNTLAGYSRHVEADKHRPGKRNTQKIERKHLTLRTRFSKSIQMHDIVIGLFVNRYEFGLLI